MSQISTQERRDALKEVIHCFPTTAGQQAFWFLDQAEHRGTAWNIAVRFRLRGVLDTERLQRAINEVVARHEILRTTFAPTEDGPIQYVHASASLTLPIEDLSEIPSGRRDEAEENRTIAEAETPFDLRQGPLIRTRLLRLAPLEHMLLVTVHHIISDGWSIGVLASEIATLYEAPGSLPELDLQFGDFAIYKNQFQREFHLNGPARNYWRKKLGHYPLTEVLPDFPRMRETRHRGFILSLLLDTHLTHALEKYAHDRQTTFFTLSLATLNVLLHRLTGVSDLCVGSLLAGRDSAEIESMIGLFVNPLLLRTTASADMSFSELLQATNETVLGALEYGDLPFADVIASLSPHDARRRADLFSINFIFQRDFVQPRQFCGLSMEPVPSKSPGAIYDLNFFMVQRADGWRLSCEYDVELYSPESVQRMIESWANLLQLIAAEPERKLSEFYLLPRHTRKIPHKAFELSPRQSAKIASAVAETKTPSLWNRIFTSRQGDLPPSAG